jgi:antirestriction protein ArdC
MRRDIYQSITNLIVAELEKGARPWFKPWNAEHAAGRIKGRCAPTEFPIRASMC